MDKEEALYHLSQILKDVAAGKYQPVPQGVPLTEPEQEELKKQTLVALQMGMREISKNLNIPDDLRKALCLSESDLERLHRKSDTQGEFSEQCLCSADR